MNHPNTERPRARPDVVLVLWNHSDEGDEAEAPAEPTGEQAAAGDEAAAPEGGEKDGAVEAESGEAAAEEASSEEALASNGHEGEGEGEGEGDREDEGDGLPAVEEGEGAAPRARIEQQADAVVSALREHGMVATSVDLEDDIDRVIDAIVLERPTVIFNLVDQYDGDGTQHAAIASLLDLLGMPYTGSEPLALASCQDRARTRLVLDDAGVPVPGYAIVRDVNALPDTSRLRAPLIVTQAFDDLYDDEGALRPIDDREELATRVYDLAREYDLPLFIEEYVGGRRLHAIVTGSRVLDVLPLCESEADEDDELTVSLSQLDSDTADRVRALARRAFRATGCRDLAQIDFHLGDDELVVTDVRPTVDLGEGSPFAVAADACEGGFSAVVHELARQAIRRARALDPGAGESGDGAGRAAPSASDDADSPETSTAPAQR